jgi:hypothetical protein
MGLRPTHGDESALLGFIDSKRVTRDSRRSVRGIYQQSTDLTHCFAYPNFFFSQSRSSISSWPYSVSSLR